MSGKSDVTKNVGFWRFVAHREDSTVTFHLQQCTNAGKKITFGIELQNAFERETL